MLIDRKTVIETICNHLRANVPQIALVKPYLGELDRFSKIQQLKAEDFPAQVNLQTPFALVISKDRNDGLEHGQQNRALRLRHDISVYIGDANTHNYNSTEVPNIVTLLALCFNALAGKSLFRYASPLYVKSDGEYLITTDIFVVYEQKYYQYDTIS